jgi:hypothetical protein
LEGEWVGEIIGLRDVKDIIVWLHAPGGGTPIELIQYYRPVGEKETPRPQSNTPGIRHIALVVDDIEAMVAKLKARGTEMIGRLYNYEDTYKLCYIRGPEDIILELAEPLK